MKINYSGYVVDEFGAPLMGANITSTTGPLRGTITNENGYFSFLEDEGAMFKISFMGFRSIYFTVTSNSYAPPKYVMVEEATQLNEVVVTPGRPYNPATLPAPVVVPPTVVVTVPEVKQPGLLDKLKKNPLATAGFVIGGLILGAILMAQTAKASDRIEEKRLLKLEN